MSIVLPFAEKFAVEEVSGDMLFPRSLATTGICTYSRKSSGSFSFNKLNHKKVSICPLNYQQAAKYFRFSFEIEFQILKGSSEGVRKV
jgi:hypothetical protein